MKHFRFKTLDEIAECARSLGAAHVRFEPDPERVRETLAKPVRVAHVNVGNSMAIHPMEGCDGALDGSPDELTYRRYRRFAAGGAKLIWFEATAVREDGRANTRQLWIHRNNVDDFARLLEDLLEIHRREWETTDDLLTPMQLTHSGRYSVPQRTIAYHNPLIDQKAGTPADAPVISDDELERLEDDYVAAAKLGYQAGFRAFELKVTHGYLLSELMGAKLREGRYGGSIENRCRFASNVLRKIRAALASNVILAIRLGCYDGVPYIRPPSSPVGEPLPYPIPYPHGFGVDTSDPLREDLTEVKRAVALFCEAGMQLMNVSLGCPYYNPHVGRPFESPDEGNYEQPEHPLLGVDRHFRIAGELQRTFPDLPIVGTGYSWLQIY